MTESRNGAPRQPVFGRLLTAMVTPFDAAGEVDYKQAQRLARALLDSGSDGLVVTGTTGEAPTLSTAEKLDLYRAVKEAAGSDGAVLAGTSTYDTRESIAVSREAEGIGVDGLLLTVPYYNRPSQEGLYRHFQAIANSVSIPGVLYNIPSRTGVNMLPETTIRLAAIPNVIGLKEASGSLDAAAKIIEETGEDFYVWSGDDGFTLPLLSVGGYGVVSVCSHIVGRQVRSLIEAFVAGRNAEAAATHRRLLPLINAVMTATPNVISPMPVKYALNALGFNVGGLRAPLCELDDEQGARLMSEVRRYKIDLPVGVQG